MRRVLLALSLLAVSGIAAAHTRGTSYSDWRLQAQGAQVRARVSQLELTRLHLDPAQPDYAQQVGALLEENLLLWAGMQRCEPAAPATVQVAEDGWVLADWSVRCAQPGAYAIRSSLFQAVAPSHLHFARAAFDNRAPQERVLTFAEPVLELGAAPDLSASFGRYVKLGAEHILSGWDHIAFVLALILLAAGLAEVALVATGFTLAHSLTLAAAVLGLAQVQAPAIEALIGYSIAVVAAENLWLGGGRQRWLPAALAGALVLLAALHVTQLPGIVLAGLALFTACYFSLARAADRPLRLRTAVAFIFGLVHGFGFAGALTPLQLPRAQLAAGLLGFNCGVEIGQLLVIALVWPLLRWLSRRPHARAWAGDAASACVCALGMFWFVTRSFG